jgi:hypothetical protein
MTITDRQCILALLDLVGALAGKLTGETPMLCLKDAEGNIIHLTLIGGDVQWFKDPSRARCCIHTEQWFQEEVERRKNEAAAVKAQAG